MPNKIQRVKYLKKERVFQTRHSKRDKKNIEEINISIIHFGHFTDPAHSVNFPLSVFFTLPLEHNQ